MYYFLCLGLAACLDTSPEYQVVFEGMDIKITCYNIKGIPKWLKDGQSGIKGAIYDRNHLKIIKVTEEASGKYVCEGYDSISYRLSNATSEVLVGCKFNCFSKLIFIF